MTQHTSPLLKKKYYSEPYYPVRILVPFWDNDKRHGTPGYTTAY